MQCSKLLSLETSINLQLDNIECCLCLSAHNAHNVDDKQAKHETHFHPLACLKLVPQNGSIRTTTNSTCDLSAGKTVS
jgi:hypothetical protein